MVFTLILSTTFVLAQESLEINQIPTQQEYELGVLGTEPYLYLANAGAIVSLGEFIFIKGGRFLPNTQYTLYFNEQKVKEIKSDKNGLIYNAFELTNQFSLKIWEVQYDFNRGLKVMDTNDVGNLDKIYLKQNGNIIDSIPVVVSSKTFRQILIETPEDASTTQRKIASFKRMFGREPTTEEIKEPGVYVLFLNPPSGKYGDKIDVYGQGFKPEKSYKLETACNTEKMNIKTDKYGKFHISGFSTDTSIFTKIIALFKSLFNEDPTPGEILEGTEELGRMCFISAGDIMGGAGIHFYIE